MTPYERGVLTGLAIGAALFGIAWILAGVRISRLESHRGYRAERRGVLL